jgi:hypothetical protein
VPIMICENIRWFPPMLFRPAERSAAGAGVLPNAP